MFFSSEVQNADRQHFSHHIFGTGSWPAGQSESTPSLETLNFFTSHLVPINKSYTYIYNSKLDVDSDRPVKKNWKKKSLETDPIALYYCPWVQRWSRKIWLRIQNNNNKFCRYTAATQYRKRKSEVKVVNLTLIINFTEP